MEADGHHLSRGYHWSAPFDVGHFFLMFAPPQSNNQ
jgi:hypothetical protein